MISLLGAKYFTVKFLLVFLRPFKFKKKQNSVFSLLFIISCDPVQRARLTHPPSIRTKLTKLMNHVSG